MDQWSSTKKSKSDFSLGESQLGHGERASRLRVDGDGRRSRRRRQRDVIVTWSRRVTWCVEAEEEAGGEQAGGGGGEQDDQQGVDDGRDESSKCRRVAT